MIEDRDASVFRGRETIYSDVEEITPSNIFEVLKKAIPTHEFNEAQINYLFNYYKGEQPILNRVKTYHNDINNKIVENRASEIVSFKTSYLCGEPIQYVARNAEHEDIAYETSRLNDIMLEQSKSAKDKEIIEWGYICGTAYRFVHPKKTFFDDEISPFEFYTLDPRTAFVIYYSGIGNRPLCGVIRSKIDGDVFYTVYTNNQSFVVDYTNENIKDIKAYSLGIIPVIEYPANNIKMGSFENVLELLNAINTVDSNRLDGVEQFIQSLLVLYNCELPEGENAESIRQKGMIILNSNKEISADIKQIANQLDQNQTQTLKDDMYQTVLTIVGMPSQGNGTTSDSSNNGAVIMRNGWQNAEARAKDSELMFRPSESRFLQLVLRICKQLQREIKLKVSDIDFRFTRRCYEDISTKANVLSILLATEKVDPELAFEVCGLFSDPESAYLASKKYIEQINSTKINTVETNNTQAEETIINENAITD